jgi:anti-sigma factor RsiW
MDHLDADKMQAVERYMLGDLSVSEVEEFERHFFDCPQCSEELRALTVFQENARAVFAEQDLAPIPPPVHAPESAVGWWRGFSPLFWNRGWGMALAALAAGSKFYTVYFDKTWDGDFASYRAVVRDASGVEKFSVPVTLGAPGEALHVLVPTRKLPAGKYVLVMTGGGAGKETELARFPYTLQIK